MPAPGALLGLCSLKSAALPFASGEYLSCREGEIPQWPCFGRALGVTADPLFRNPLRRRVRSYDVTMEPEEEPEVECAGDAAVETYPVSVEPGRLILHL